MTLESMLSDLWWRARDVVGGDPLGGDIPKEVWVLKLNQAQDKLAEMGLIIDDYALTSAVLDQNDYLLPDYCLELSRVLVKTSSTGYYKSIPAIELGYLNKTTPSWRDTTSKDYPDYYFQEGRWLGFYPAFNADLTAGIRIEGLFLGETLSANDDVSKILKHYHKYIVLEAFCSLFPEHKQTPKYEKYLQTAYMVIQRRMTKPDAGERTIVTPGGD